MPSPAQVGTTFYVIYTGAAKVFVKDHAADMRARAEGGAAAAAAASADPKGTCVCVLEDGDSFGELALLGSGVRAATVVTAMPTRFLKIEKNAYEGTRLRPRTPLIIAAPQLTPLLLPLQVRALAPEAPRRRPLRAHQLPAGRLPLLRLERRRPREARVRDGDAQVREELDGASRCACDVTTASPACRPSLLALIPARYPPLQIIRQGEATECVYFLKDGTCRVLMSMALSQKQAGMLGERSPRAAAASPRGAAAAATPRAAAAAAAAAASPRLLEVTELKAGQYFGETSLLEKRPHTASIVAVTPVEVCAALGTPPFLHTVLNPAELPLRTPAPRATGPRALKVRLLPLLRRPSDAGAHARARAEHLLHRSVGTNADGLPDT